MKRIYVRFREALEPRPFSPVYTRFLVYRSNQQNKTEGDLSCRQPSAVLLLIYLFRPFRPHVLAIAPISDPHRLEFVLVTLHCRGGIDDGSESASSSNLPLLF